MHDAQEHIIVGQKSAQMGYTETALNKAFKALDIDGMSVLYVLPASNPDAHDFSTSRFDPALELSHHLRDLFSDVKNIGHKRAGTANLFVRGSRSRSQLKSIPVGQIFFDEVDEMCQENIPLAMERISGHIDPRVMLISTPTIPKHGINEWFENSSQDHFFFKCPKCSRHIELLYPDSLVITADNHKDPKIKESYLICPSCKGKLNHETKSEWLANGEWISQKTDTINRGFYINQLYSCVRPPSVVAIQAVSAEYNPMDEQELWNSKLGLPHVTEGAAVTDPVFDNCIGDFVQAQVSPPGYPITMGVDIGKWLHYEIDQWIIDGTFTGSEIHMGAVAKILKVGKVKSFNEIFDLCKRFGVHFTVVDENPEKRKALDFAASAPGYIKLCRYPNGVPIKQIRIHDEEEHLISVDRTSWLDISLGRFHTKTIRVPRNIPLEYRQHIKTPVRIYEKDRVGNPTSKYVTPTNESDHFAHARNYAEVALPLAYSLAQGQDIRGLL
jgi:hypothetical protein